MRKITAPPVPGYVVVESGIEAGIDHPDLFRQVSEWVKLKKQFADVELVPLLTEKVEPDAIIIPDGPLRPRWLWRLKARWYNFWRRRANVIEAERQKAYYSPESVERRRMASQ